MERFRRKWEEEKRNPLAVSTGPIRQWSNNHDCKSNRRYKTASPLISWEDKRDDPPHHQPPESRDFASFRVRRGNWDFAPIPTRGKSMNKNKKKKQKNRKNILSKKLIRPAGPGRQRHATRQTAHYLKIEYAQTISTSNIIADDFTVIQVTSHNIWRAKKKRKIVWSWII